VPSTPRPLDTDGEKKKVNFRKVWVTIIALTLPGCSNPKTNQDVALAKNALEEIFKEDDPAHNKPFEWGNPKILGKYFDSTLVGLFKANEECETRTKEVCNLDGDPIWNAQDYDEKGIKAEISHIPNSEGMVFKVKISNLGQHFETVHMVFENGNWKIKDIEYEGESSTLLKYMSNDVSQY
jgi:hypothetical protein